MKSLGWVPDIDVDHDWQVEGVDFVATRDKFLLNVDSLGCWLTL